MRQAPWSLHGVIPRDLSLSPWRHTLWHARAVGQRTRRKDVNARGRVPKTERPPAGAERTVKLATNGVRRVQRQS